MAETAIFDEFKGKDRVFVADWLKAKGLHKLVPYLKVFKRRRLRISRIDGQARKIENPDNLPEEHLWRTIFENVIVIF